MGTDTLWFFYIGVPLYHASSPDEEALVGAAREMGWVFLSRTRDSLTLSELESTHQYDLLALLDFTSMRRRMSVLGESQPPFTFVYGALWKTTNLQG